MENWLERVKKSVFPLSFEKEDIRRALTEWYYTGETYDLELPSEVCELCGHPEIRYQFTIRNQKTAYELQIGSECITRFEIPAVNEKGATLSPKETRKVVAKDRRKLITDAKERRMIQTLIELKKIQENFPIDSFIEYYQERHAFTPNQLTLLLWRLKANAIAHRLGERAGVRAGFKLKVNCLLAFLIRKSQFVNRKSRNSEILSKVKITKRTQFEKCKSPIKHWRFLQF